MRAKVPTRHERSVRRGLTARRAAYVAIACSAVLVVSAGCRGGEHEDASAQIEARRHAARLAGTWIPETLGVERAVAVITRTDGSDERVFVREDRADVASQPAHLASIVTLLAALRAGTVTASTRVVCDGSVCPRVHGSVSPADALALGCNAFFTDVAGRLGSSALGASFITLGLAPPPIPEDRTARIALGARSEGWSLTPRAALALAHALIARPAPWFADVLDPALVPRVSDPGPLRGVASTDNREGWFVGYANTDDARTIAVRVSGCVDSCAAAAVRVARFAYARTQPVVTSDAAVRDASAPRRGRTRATQRVARP